MSDSLKNIENLIETNKVILNDFEEWISTQSHVPQHISKIVLVRYLKVCDFNLEKAKKLLDNNVKFRVSHQYLFANRDVDSEEFRTIMKTVHFTRLPKLSKEGYAIDVNRIVDLNANNFIIIDLFRACLMIHDMYNLIRPIENGVIAIYDAQNFIFQHFLKVLAHPSAVMHFLQFGQETTCIDIKQIHLVNCSSVINNVIKFLKPFFTKELYEKLHCHSSGFETLHKFIDKDCLPVEFGGSEGYLDEYMEEMVTNLHINRDFVCEDENFFIDK